jgi:hypothetical protein
MGHNKNMERRLSIFAAGEWASTKDSNKGLKGAVDCPCLKMPCFKNVLAPDTAPVWYFCRGRGIFGRAAYCFRVDVGASVGSFLHRSIAATSVARFKKKARKNLVADILARLVVSVANGRMGGHNGSQAGIPCEISACLS